MKRILASLIVLSTGCRLWAGSFATNGCSAAWDETTLTVGNGLFSRTYRASGDALATVSWRRKDQEWSDASRSLRPSGTLTACARGARMGAVGADGLEVTVTTGSRTRRLWLFPNVAGVLADDPFGVSIPADYEPPSVKSKRFGLDFGALRRVILPGADYLPLKPTHLKVTEFRLQDMTDSHCELLATEEWLLRECRAVSAPVVTIEDQGTGEGLVFVRFAPLPHVRSVKVPDFCIGDRLDRHNVPWFAAVPNGYPYAEIAYAGGRAGRIAALVAIQRAWRAYRPDRDGLFLSNTWGDCNRDRRLNAAFMATEIRAGSELGIDVIQIDDGWEKGVTFNSSRASKAKPGAHRNYRKSDPDFWQPNPERFPDGLEPIVAAAKNHGMSFGLWFSPEVADDCADWKKDADTMLDYWRRLGVRYFKIDQLEMESPVALENQRKMFARMLEASRGDMTFDLDVTGNVRRPGYFGMSEVGPLFVENRYWEIASYWPHLTLRAAWSLAEVIDPVRLRMEFANPLHGQDRYPDSPLAPKRWRGDTLFATVMNFSPLAWCEVSELSAQTVAEMKPLVAAWKRERANVHGGVTVPVGARPDGFTWTGFLTRGADGENVYALLFRELDRRECTTLDIGETFAGCRLAQVEVLGGRGTAEISNGRHLAVNIPATLDFIWVKGKVKK